MKSRAFLILWILIDGHLWMAHAQGYYPLETGNLWEYWDCLQSFYDHSAEVVGDTVMPNGQTYAALQLDVPFFTTYFRQDSSLVYTYSTFEGGEFLWYDFSKTTGDTVAINYYQGDTTVVTVLYDRISSVFGSMRRQWGFYERSLISSAYGIREVTDSIGLTYETFEAAQYDICLRGAIIDGVRYGQITSIVPAVDPNVQNYRLFQNYPNPFNGSTTISFQLPEREVLSLKIFDLLGKELKVLFEGEISAGEHSMIWDGKNSTGNIVGTGIYFCKLQGDHFSKSTRMIVIH